MQKKALVGLLLVLLSLILIITSLRLPWYKIEVKAGEEGAIYTSDLEFYLDHAKSSMLGMTSEFNYDEENLGDMNYVQTFQTTQTIVFVGIAGCIIGMMGAALVMIGKIGAKIGAMLVLLAIILTLMAPLYLMLALPDAFEKDFQVDEGDDPESDVVFNRMGNEFFGSEEYESYGIPNEVSWGGSSGWFISIIAMIMCIIAIILVAFSPSAKRSIYPISAPSSDVFEKYQAIKISEQKDLVDHAGYQKESIESPPVFQPLLPSVKQPQEKDTVPPHKSTQYLCPRCDKVIIVSVPKRPLPVNCRNCGLVGMVE